MKTAATESLAKLLRTAHAVEQGFLDAVKEYMETVSCPDAQVRIRTHLVEMQWQSRLLEACLEFQDDEGMTSDNEVSRQASEAAKTGLLAIKRFKITFYKKIIAEARKQQAPEVLQACREILEQERGMAEWIEDNYSRLPRRTESGRSSQATLEV